MRYYCTYFDRHYLNRGLALVESLRRHETSPFAVFVVCMDEITRTALAQLAVPEIRTIPLHEIEWRDAALLETKEARSLVEYYWTMTPTIILRILERHPEVELLTYLDADLFFFSSPQPIFDELDRHSILIHEHRFSPSQAGLGRHNGRFNVGLLCFRRDRNGMDALRWWRARCLEWCFARYEQGKMGDQLYLEDWPDRFRGIRVLQHPGGGVGPWNHDGYDIRAATEGRITVDGAPLIFYHFHSLKSAGSDLAIPVAHAHYRLTIPVLTHCFVPYLEALDQAQQRLAGIVPGTRWGVEQSVDVAPQLSVLARRALADKLAPMTSAYRKVSLNHEWDAYCSGQVIVHSGMSEGAVSGGLTKSVSMSVKSDGQVKHCEDAGLKKPMATSRNPVSDEDAARLCANVVLLTQACADLSEKFARSSIHPEGLSQELNRWSKAHATDPMVASLINQLQQRDPRLIAFLPQRLKLAMGYFARPLRDLIVWLGASNETTNLTYDLTSANTTHLAWMLSLVTSTPLSVIEGFLAELDQDVALKNHIRQKTADHTKRLTADAEARYGRRAGWYALVRALKPKVIVETGVDKGLGTCVLASALLRNRAEGYEGRLYATDIEPTAGFLFADPYDQVGKIIYGDSIETLRCMTEQIDLFIADSAHTAEYERGEYDTVQQRLAPRAIVISDNAHVTQELSHFAQRTERQFLYFQEVPQDHFYPGAGMGIAYQCAIPSRSSTAVHEVNSSVGSLSSVRQNKEVEAVGHMTSPPLVSVLVSAYESEAFMQECLEDLVGQTIADQIEIIVVDAASPQREGRIVKNFQDRYRNITYIRTSTRVGVYAAWNIAAKRATGRYITPFSTNDRLRPDAYEILARTLDERQDVALVYGDTYLTDQPHQTFGQHKRIGIWQWPEYRYEDLLRYCLIGPHPMWRRELHHSIGYFDETYTALGDQDFWIRVGARHKLLHIPVVTGLYWRSPDGLSNRAEIAGPEERRLRATHRLSEDVAVSVPAMKAETQYDCSVIIPVWNRCELTRNCVEALAKTTNGVSWELIVVDNHSTDGTLEFLSSLGGDVQIIRNEENLGFATACNQGAQTARGKYLVFLNNDTVPLEGWLGALISEVEGHSEVGVVGSKLLYQDGTIQHAGVVFNRRLEFPYHIYKRRPGDWPIVNQRRECQVVTAACMLIRRMLFEEIGGFDEGFHNGLEDADLCLKVREKGFRVVYQPRSVLYHLEGQTASRNLHEDSNDRRLRERWGSHWWLVDEDLHYHSDGFKVVVSETASGYVSELKVLENIKDRAAWAHVAAAQAAAQKKDWIGVKRELGLVQDWPSDHSVLSWAAMVCEKLDEPALRHTFLTRYLELKDSPSVRLTLVRSLLAHKSLAAAEQQLNSLLAGSPDDAEGLLLRGLLCMQREQYREAEAAFGTAMRQGADRKKCLMGMGMASMGRAYAQGAWERFLEVLVEDPDDAEAIHWLLRAGTAQNRWKELGLHLRQYLLRNPGDLAVRFALASVLMRGEQIEEARYECAQLRALDPSYDGLVELGQALANKEAALAYDLSNS